MLEGLPEEVSNVRSLVIPEGPAAAPFRAVLKLRQNVPPPT